MYPNLVVNSIVSLSSQYILRRIFPFWNVIQEALQLYSQYIFALFLNTVGWQEIKFFNSGFFEQPQFWLYTKCKKSENMTINNCFMNMDKIQI